MKKDIEIKVLALGAVTCLIILTLFLQNRPHQPQSGSYSYGEKSERGLKVGDRVGAFTVKDLYYDHSQDFSEYPESLNPEWVDYSGEVEIRGKFSSTTEFGQCIVPLPEDVYKIPQETGNKQTWFCFRNYKDPLIQKLKIDATTTVLIGNYREAFMIKESSNLADLVKIVSKNKNSTTETSLNTLSKVKVGDRVGSLVVKDIYYDNMHNYPLWVAYDGELTIRGRYWANEIHANFFPLDEKITKLPRVSPNNQKQFCFRDPESQILKNELKEGVTTTIIVKNYFEDNRATEGCNLADIVKIISE